ncbi:MAG: apolipoprotein N-acyltransferase [Planctomycetales bacterium]|nr:apolipoprotein N-acyltransferase [Planctomycetales bacterium]NIM08919.1 apolipoprotein N-acyltransferase [Planctomycetales bacterium]NIN08389.1 apolipoprotein N-acyltransferase [Planctomycetales bacterium]NIN77517.1 apolipoprotein N-acyltransferase [Planctomycetales bacterium]NIO34689.1 apolipoprotein N-acyltransferase [Planctomycetales bacterium]
MSTATGRTSVDGERKALQSGGLQPAGRDTLAGSRTTVGLGLLGSLTFWMSQPPLDWGPLGWVAPVFWLLLIRQPRLSGWRPYGVLYLVGVVYWGASTYWLTLPHWSAALGWVAMFLYLACYVPLFVGLSRVAVHRLAVPLIVAAPVVWTGLELVRAHFATGFLMAALAHTQYRWIGLIQVSDLVGAYGLSFLMMFISACLTMSLPGSLMGMGGRPAPRWPLAAGAAALIAALAYGHFRTVDHPTRAGPKVALIQGSIDTVFGGDPLRQRTAIYRQYINLSRQALHRDPGLDLLVWPESMYIVPLVLIDEGAFLPEEQLVQGFHFPPAEAAAYQSEKRLPEAIDEWRAVGRAWFSQTAATIAEAAAAGRKDSSSTNKPALLLGLDCEHYRPGGLDRFNTSLYLNPQGEVIDYYHKMHPVMFGEYVPLGNWFPALYRLTPLSGGLTAGSEPKAYEIAGARLTPNICYETILPHVIRRQVASLRDEGREPDILITQTNDGWFWGSAALDMHLICGVFRAVECRKPLLIAANTGISAHIDADGRILAHGPRRETDTLIVRPQIDARLSGYVLAGDWFAWLCAASSAGLALVGWKGWKR